MLDEEEIMFIEKDDEFGDIEVVFGIPRQHTALTK